MRKWMLIATVALSSGCDEYTLDQWLDFRDWFVKLDAESAEVADLTAELASASGFEFEPIHQYDKVNKGFAMFVPVPIATELQDRERVLEVVEVPADGYVPPDEEDSKVDIDNPITVDPDEIPESIERIGGPWVNGGLGAVQVAVIDTGVDSFHSDLNVVAEFDAVRMSGGTPANGNDPNGHGTHVAGTIGALANGDGVVGVAPGVGIHAVRVLDENGSGLWTDILAGIEYVLDHPEIRVVNMSLGGAGNPDAANDELRDAIQALEDSGVIVCIAAGNDTANTNGFVPAGYDIGVVVSAYDASDGSDNGFASFSNFGDAVDIASPGVKIRSTWPGGTYAELNGTSMATPAVAGVAAAWLVANPSGTPQQFRNQLVSTGENGYQGQNNNRHPEPLVDAAAVWQ
ncbi:MAG: S8 family serine peptidase [Alphaproteobacteria bacterium]|nr:S8 family serine peptidase [Alphaproteobacteria bacterium]